MYIPRLECASDSPIAQSVERRTVNPQVPGSSPGWRAKILKTHSLSGFFLIYLLAYLFIKKLFVFDSSQITFFIIGCIASLALLTIFLQQFYRPKQKFYAKRVITRYETKMFYRLKDAFPEHHVMAQVAFSALITNEHLKIRSKFNRKVTDFVLLDQELKVIAIIELDDPSHIGKEVEDARRDAMLNEAGYHVYRYTDIPNIKVLRKDIIG